MTISYTISVKNVTGSPHDYCIISDRPIVAGSSGHDVFNNVMKVSRHVERDNVASFTFSDYYAINGHYSERDDPRLVSITKSIPVTLGSMSNGPIRGSSVTFSGGGSQQGDLKISDGPQAGILGNFQFDTGSDFTIHDAINNRLCAGVGMLAPGEGVVPAGTFMPEPNTRCQVMPRPVFHLAIANNLQNWQVVDLKVIGELKTVDFQNQQSNSIMIQHTEEGFQFAEQ